MNTILINEIELQVGFTQNKNVNINVEDIHNSHFIFRIYICKKNIDILLLHNYNNIVATKVR